jgi:hypothetical protein
MAMAATLKYKALLFLMCLLLLRFLPRRAWLRVSGDTMIA